MEQLFSKEINEKLKTLPLNPGVYLMRNEKGEIIYVGKARVLKNRVRQYFTKEGTKPPKVAAMVRNIHSFEYIITDSELEALILECNLIKRYQPHYNILLKDGKQYPYVRIDTKEAYPRIEIVRKVQNDGAKYFGPFLAAHSVREALDAIHKLFPLRSCKKDLSKKQGRPCLNYQMGRCLAPCQGNISPEKYQAVVQQVIAFLNGKYESLAKEMEKEMLAASDRLDFERAAVFRDKLRVLTKVAERQKAGFPDLKDRDLFAIVSGKETAVVQAFLIRKGKLSQADRYFLQTQQETEGQVLEEFLKQYYMGQTAIPKNIMISAPMEEMELLEQWLSGLRGAQVSLAIPQRGNWKRLMDMAKHNAAEALKRKEDREKREYESTVGAAAALGEMLGIPYPKRMECYDISNTQGTDSVASMVVFIDGKPKKAEYRRFRIKNVQGPNDFASMQEVLTRRLQEGFAAKIKTTGFGMMPDLLVIDGGKGQLSSAMEILEAFGLEDLPAIGLAKREEEIFMPGKSEPILLSKQSPELKLLMAIRDEAHRFAITYHRALREKRTLGSELDRIPGVGPKRKSALIQALGDLEQIGQASIDELAAIPGIDIATARSIYRYFSEK